MGALKCMPFVEIECSIVWFDSRPGDLSPVSAAVLSELRTLPGHGRIAIQGAILWPQYAFCLSERRLGILMAVWGAANRMSFPEVEPPWGRAPGTEAGGVVIWARGDGSVPIERLLGAFRPGEFLFRVVSAGDISGSVGRSAAHIIPG